MLILPAPGGDGQCRASSVKQPGHRPAALSLEPLPEPGRCSARNTFCTSARCRTGRVRSGSTAQGRTRSRRARVSVSARSRCGIRHRGPSPGHPGSWRARRTGSGGFRPDRSPRIGQEQDRRTPIRSVDVVHHFARGRDPDAVELGFEIPTGLLRERPAVLDAASVAGGVVLQEGEPVAGCDTAGRADGDEARLPARVDLPTELADSGVTAPGVVSWWVISPFLLSWESLDSIGEGIPPRPIAGSGALPRRTRGHFSHKSHSPIKPGSRYSSDRREPPRVRHDHPVPRPDPASNPASGRLATVLIVWTASLTVLVLAAVRDCPPSWSGSCCPTSRWWRGTCSPGADRDRRGS